eukprot:360622-Chlamydomonas_euryale.AAC.13
MGQIAGPAIAGMQISTRGCVTSSNMLFKIHGCGAIASCWMSLYAGRHCMLDFKICKDPTTRVYRDKKRSPPDSTTSPAAQGYIDAGPYASLVPTVSAPCSSDSQSELQGVDTTSVYLSYGEGQSHSHSYMVRVTGS